MADFYTEDAWHIDWLRGVYSTRIRMRVGKRKQSKRVVVTEREINEAGEATQELLRTKLTEARDMLMAEMTLMTADGYGEIVNAAAKLACSPIVESRRARASANLSLDGNRALGRDAGC